MSSINQIICERRNYTAIKNKHAHDFYQLLLPLQGSLYIETNQHHITLDDHHLFLLPPDCEHLFFSHDRNEFLVLDIPTFTFSVDSVQANQGSIHLPCDDHWKAIRFLLLNESSNKQANQQGLLHLLHYASQLFKAKKEYPSLQYIHEHYHEDISVQNLAELEHYQLSYYIQWFRGKTGMTPKAYIQHLRMQEAKQLLRETNLSISHIAHQVGYEYQASLTRLFVQYEDMTPKEYRSQHRQSG